MKVVKLGADKIVTGEGALTHLCTLEGEIHRALIVMGKGSLVKNGALDKLQETLSAANIQSEVFMGVGADPTYSTVKAGVEKAMEFEPDAIIGFGGGSAIDAAKVIWVFYENPDRITFESVLLPNQVPDLGKRSRLIAIPTTAGTGSEVTRVAVITDDETHLKRVVVDLKLRMIPSLTLICPEFTLSMPPSVTADSGMDALTHAIESYVCTLANPYSEALSIGAFRVGYNNLPKAYENGGNVEYRDMMLTASCMAGIAFSNSSLGIAHSIAHTLGAQYGIAHGKACALALPHVIAYNSKSEDAKVKYDELARLVGFDNLGDAIVALCEQIGIPTCIRSLVGDKDTFEARLAELASIAVKDASTGSNPVPVDEEAMVEILRGMY